MQQIRILSVKQNYSKEISSFVLIGKYLHLFGFKAILAPILGKHTPPTECCNKIKPEQNAGSNCLRILKRNASRQVGEEGQNLRYHWISEFTIFVSSSIPWTGLKAAQNLELGNQHIERSQRISLVLTWGPGKESPLMLRVSERNHFFLF